jgi:hypothetical protein
MRWREWLAVAVITAVPSLVTPDGQARTAFAQLREPPRPATLYVDDPLNFEGAARAISCRTGRNRASITSEGLAFRVTGKCADTATTAALTHDVELASIGDGESRFEWRIVGGAERARVGIELVDDGDARGVFVANVEPERSLAYVFRRRPEPAETVTERTDVGQFIDRGGWNSLALRTLGSTVWVLMNDTPVLQVADVAERRWRPRIVVQRVGDPNDDVELRVVVRNLRISAVEGGLAERVPRVEMFVPGPVAGAAFVPADGTPGAATPPVFESPLDTSGPLTTGTCATGRGSAAYAGGAHVFAIRGQCAEHHGQAWRTNAIRGLSVPDGEFSIEYRLGDGPERSRLWLWTRLDRDANGGLVLELTPSFGWVSLLHRGPGRSSRPWSRGDIAPILRPLDWNHLALRMSGDRVWLLLNGHLVLSERSEPGASGEVYLGVQRLGPVEDEAESSVMFRNLRVSAIEGGDPSRAPSYSPPPPPGSPPPPPAPAAGPGPPPRCAIGTAQLMNIDGVERRYCSTSE